MPLSRKTNSSRTPRGRAPVSPAARQVTELPLHDPGERGHRSFVLYGRSGTGKTTLAATWPKPALLLDIKDVGDDSISDVLNLKVMDINNVDDMETAYWYLYNKSIKMPYKTVILDTVSQLQQLFVQKISKAGDKAGQWGTMTMRNWGDCAMQMKAWITRFRDLPVDVVFIAQDRVFGAGDDDDTDTSIIQPEVGPALSPSIAKHLNASVHVIGHTFIRRRKLKRPLGSTGKAKQKEVTEFCLRMAPDPVYTTKIRKPKSQAFPGMLVNPSYDIIKDIIRGER